MTDYQDKEMTQEEVAAFFKKQGRRGTDVVVSNKLMFFGLGALAVVIVIGAWALSPGTSSVKEVTSEKATVEKYVSKVLTVIKMVQVLANESGNILRQAGDSEQEKLFALSLVTTQGQTLIDEHILAQIDNDSEIPLHYRSFNSRLRNALRAMKTVYSIEGIQDQTAANDVRDQISGMADELVVLVKADKSWQR